MEILVAPKLKKFKKIGLALGGGGATKLVGDFGISRIFNFKNPDEYIKRFDEILEKKESIKGVFSSGSN